MKWKIFFLVGVLATVLSSCNEDENQNKTLLPVITGKSGEVVIVFNKNKYPKTLHALKNIFTEDYPMLPQEEDIFTPVLIPHDAFNSIFKTHRNVLVINIKKDIPQDSAGLFVKKNIWAAPQLIIEGIAPDDTTMAKILLEKKNYIINLINEWERKRIVDTYKKIQDNKVVKRIEDKFNIYITVPKGYAIRIDTTNFMWISRETAEMSQGLFIYTYPYKDTSDFNWKSLLNKRDEFEGKYVKGPTEGSWMTTERRIEPDVMSYSKKGNYFVKIRGLWKIENDYMGGPFVSVSTLSADKTQIITVEGYVYAPKYKKREYVRQLEAILSTIEPIKEKTLKKN